MKTPHRIAALLLLAATLTVALAPAPARSELPPLVPREVFLGNPVKTQARISPDGTRLTYIAPSETNVLNVWLRTIGKDDDRQITKDVKRGIRAYFWAKDGKHVLYLQDADGNIEGTHSISAGLDYASVGPEHAWLHAIGRTEYAHAGDAEALDAFRWLARTEGLLAALESSHAIAWLRRGDFAKGAVVLVNLSGRGDKDVDSIRGMAT